MPDRIVFEFLVSPDQHPEQWEQVRRFLDSAGATFYDTPSGNPPYILRVVLPEGTDVDAFLTQLRALPGVGRADRDALRRTY